MKTLTDSQEESKAIAETELNDNEIVTRNDTIHETTKKEKNENLDNFPPESNTKHVSIKPSGLEKSSHDRISENKNSNCNRLNEKKEPKQSEKQDQAQSCSTSDSNITETNIPSKKFQFIVTLSSYLDRTYRYWNKHNRWFYLSFALVAFYVIATRARPLPNHFRYHQHRSFHLRLWPRIRNLSNSIFYPRYFRHSLQQQEQKEPPPHPTFLIDTTYEEGLQKWRETLEWRSNNRVDYILSYPPPKYNLLKSVFLPTSLYNHDKKGNVILVEQWGKVDTRALKQHKISHQEMIDLFVFETEWLWSIGQPKPTDRLTLIMDVKNIPMDRFLSLDALRLVKERIQIGCNHYPNRGAHIIIANIPPFFNTVYKLIASVLTEETKDRLILMTPHEIMKENKMLQYIDKRYLLPEYGGTSKTKFGHSSMDTRLKKHVTKHGKNR